MSTFALVACLLSLFFLSAYADIGYESEFPVDMAIIPDDEGYQRGMTKQSVLDIVDNTLKGWMMKSYWTPTMDDKHAGLILERGNLDGKIISFCKKSLTALGLVNDLDTIDVYADNGCGHSKLEYKTSPVPASYIGYSTAVTQYRAILAGYRSVCSTNAVIDDVTITDGTKPIVFKGTMGIVGDGYLIYLVDCPVSKVKVESSLQMSVGIKWNKLATDGLKFLNFEVMTYDDGDYTKALNALDLNSVADATGKTILTGFLRVWMVTAYKYAKNFAGELKLDKSFINPKPRATQCDMWQYVSTQMAAHWVVDEDFFLKKFRDMVTRTLFKDRHREWSTSEITTSIRLATRKDKNTKALLPDTPDTTKLRERLVVLNNLGFDFNDITLGFSSIVDDEKCKLITWGNDYSTRVDIMNDFLVFEFRGSAPTECAEDLLGTDALADADNNKCWKAIEALS